MQGHDKTLAVLSGTPQVTSAAGLARLRQAREREDAANAARDGKASVASLSEGRTIGQIRRINPYLVHIEPHFNVRDDEAEDNAAHVMWLAANIAEIGLLTPLEVYYNTAAKKIFVIDGHCRLRAVWYAIEVLGADIQFIRIQEIENAGSEMDRFVRMMTSSSSKTPSAFERAGKIKQMMSVSGLTVAELASKLGRKSSTLEEWIRTDDMVGPEIRKMVKSGLVATSTAMESLERHRWDQDKALAEIRKGVEISAGDKSSKGKVMPRHIKEARTGRPVVPVRAELRGLFEARQIHVHNDGQRVLMQCTPEVYRRLCSIIDLEDEETRRRRQADEADMVRERAREAEGGAEVDDDGLPVRFVGGDVPEGEPN